MPDRPRGFWTSWPVYAFLAVAFALWGIVKLTRGDDGADTFFGIVYLVVAVGNAARAVVAARRPTA
ncbi:hypothetical protein [Nakamurella deserti]|uniref:hypothetical protein n=1 Tax=Nakamurella deserti TaxID=2164074 RepID=UPI00130061C8|nr:hypothetical protein [Nakamurella deserti]